MGDKHWLTITIKDLYCKRILMNGSYLIGRQEHKCREKALSFNTPITIISLPQAPRQLSGFHACLLKCEDNYALIDGWGRDKSTNGIYINHLRRTYFDFLYNGDTAFLGCQEVCLKYEIEKYQTELDQDEKGTLSQIFEL